MTGTHAQRLAGLLLGEPVVDWLLAERASVGDKKGTLRFLSRRLHEATDGQVDVTPETIRLWLIEAQTVEAAG